LAFAHALRIALAAKCKLDIMHVDASHDAEWSDFPGVRELLEQWKILPEGSPRDAVLALGMNVHKAIVEDSNVVRGTLKYLESHPADLIVLAVHHQEGRMRWLHRNVGEPIGKESSQTTLYLPHGTKGFVGWDDGKLTLKKILIPVAQKPSPQPSLDAVAALVRGLGVEAGEITLLHVGSEQSAPSWILPEIPGWEWRVQIVPGNPIDTIVETTKALSADLLVMTTDGPDGFLDGLRGSHTERVLRQTQCPLLVIPLGAGLLSRDSVHSGA
jgi:nucleotide-binding universal stress UspA family protein